MEIFFWCDAETVINVRKFTKVLYYEGNVKFDDIYDVFEEITEIVLNFS